MSHPFLILTSDTGDQKRSDLMKANIKLDHQLVAVEGEQVVNAMLDLDAPAPGGTNRERPPLHLALVIDRSGSMAGPKLEHTKAAADYLIRRLEASDQMAIVAYDDGIDLVSSLAPVDSDHLRNAVRNIHVGGMTNLSGGWWQRKAAALILASVTLMFLFGLMMRGAMFTPQRDDVLTILITYGGYLGNLASGVSTFWPPGLATISPTWLATSMTMAPSFGLGGAVERAGDGGCVRNRRRKEELDAQYESFAFRGRASVRAVRVGGDGAGRQEDRPRAPAVRPLPVRLFHRCAGRTRLGDETGARLTDAFGLRRGILRVDQKFPLHRCCRRRARPARPPRALPAALDPAATSRHDRHRRAGRPPSVRDESGGPGERFGKLLHALDAPPARRGLRHKWRSNALRALGRADGNARHALGGRRRGTQRVLPRRGRHTRTGLSRLLSRLVRP